MKITHIEYRELYSPPYGHCNFTFGATAEVGETILQDAIAGIKGFVQKQLKKDHEEYESLKAMKVKLEADISRLKGVCRELADHHRFQEAALRGTLEKEMWNDQLPF